MTSRPRSSLLVALTLALLLTGCSQVAALAPVGGDSLAEVRYGAIDVLLDHGVEIGVAPVCTTGPTAPTVTCAGTTMSGVAISVTSSTAAGAVLSVSVGSIEVFSGALQDVLDAAARG